MAKETQPVTEQIAQGTNGNGHLHGRLEELRPIIVGYEPLIGRNHHSDNGLQGVYAAMHKDANAERKAAVPGIGIQRAHTFADGSSVVTLGDASSVNSVVSLAAGEIIVRTRISEDTTNWMKKRFGNDQIAFSDEPFWAIVDPRKEATLKVLDTQAAQQPRKYERLEGSRPEDNNAPDFVPDSPEVYRQKQAVKKALVADMKDAIAEGTAVEVFRDEERAYYAMPATAEMSAKSGIEGDPESKIAQFKTPQILVKPDQHLILAIDENGERTEFVSQSSLRSRIASDTIQALKGENRTTLGTHIKAVTKADSARVQLAGYATTQVLSSVDVMYPVTTLPKPTTYSPDEEWQRKTGRLPTGFASYLSADWLEEQRSQAQQRQEEGTSKKRNTVVTGDPATLSGFKEPFISYLLDQPADQWESLIRDYTIREVNLPKDVSEMSRNQGLRRMEDPKKSLIRLYHHSTEFLNQPWEELPDFISANVNDPNLRQSLLSTYNGSSNLPLEAQRREQLIRSLTAALLDKLARGLGRRNFDRQQVGEPRFSLKYEDVYAAEIARLSQPSNLIDQYNAEPLQVNMGPEKQIILESTEGPFFVLPEYETQYPQSVLDALGRVYKKYNKAMTNAAGINQEWDTDYQYTKDAEGTNISRQVQIDMKGLSPAFLAIADTLPPTVLEQAIQDSLFEIENNLAMYQLLEKIFADPTGDSLFNREFRKSLDEIREQIGKPIAIFTETPRKYLDTCNAEFGKESVDDADVRRLSGFDKIFGPEEFAQHLKENGGKSQYALYGRVSLPLDKLGDPKVEVAHPLLSDPEIRREIKANAITLNIDNPDWTSDPEQRHRIINDTKVGYMVELGMGYAIDTNNIPWRVEGEHIVLEPEFESFLLQKGVNPENVKIGRSMLRAKPGGESYGCYGHHRLILTKNEGLSELVKDMDARGSYIVQPEMRVPKLKSADGEEFDYIDRVFMRIDKDGNPVFMGGFRTLIPSESIEAKNGRHHGTDFTRWAPINAKAA